MGRKRKVEEDVKDEAQEGEDEQAPMSKGSKKSASKKKKSKDREGPCIEESTPPSKKNKAPKKGTATATKTNAIKKEENEKKAHSKAKSSSSSTLFTKEEEIHDEDEDEEDIEAADVPDAEFDPENLPPVDVLYKLLDRMEMHLPKEDRVKYDSQVRKLDWEKIAFEGFSASQCQTTWMYIQERIRRFRVLSEMIPDARQWIQHPWTNFYKSRTFNRHPDMPKKPLSVYMFYYSQHMNKILKKNPELSMPEVAKLCSEQYAKLSDEKKLKYKEKCDEMKLEYNKKMDEFYKFHPEMAPNVKSKKAKTPQVQPEPVTSIQPTYIVAPQSVLTIPTTAPQTKIAPTPQNNIVYDPKYLPKIEKTYYPGAPERPFKPFDLFFKKEMESCSSDPAFDRQAFAQKCRKEWKEMKYKKKAKWIKTAFENYRKYEGDLKEFMAQNPGYVPPTTTHKNFLTIEDQKILDRSMGRPEKPSSSAYSLFSKEMLNNDDIKKYPSKERMSHISELWKTLPEDKKERYQAEVNEAMGIYRQKYEDWFSGLNEEERKAESDRNQSKSSRKTAVVKEKPPQVVTVQQPSQYITLQATAQQPSNVPVIMQQQPLTLLPKHPEQSVEQLKEAILKREPVEPARSRRQLFISQWIPNNKKKKISDANKMWKAMSKQEKRKWRQKLQPQRQKYIEDYTVFVRGLSKQELEIYTELKQKRDEEEEAKQEEDDSDSEESETSESESDESSD